MLKIITWAMVEYCERNTLVYLRDLEILITFQFCFLKHKWCCPGRNEERIHASAGWKRGCKSLTTTFQSIHSGASMYLMFMHRVSALDQWASRCYFGFRALCHAVFTHFLGYMFLFLLNEAFSTVIGDEDYLLCEICWTILDLNFVFSPCF